MLALAHFRHDLLICTCDDGRYLTNIITKGINLNRYLSLRYARNSVLSIVHVVSGPAESSWEGVKLSGCDFLHYARKSSMLWVAASPALCESNIMPTPVSGVLGS